jgi:hypothetical protein
MPVNVDRKNPAFYSYTKYDHTGKKFTVEPCVKPGDENKHCLACTREIYYNSYTNKLKCCHINNGVDATSIKNFEKMVKDIDKGIQRIECKRCDLSNFRERTNNFWINPESGNSHIDLQMSNYCPASCLYCKSEYSSTWENEIKENDNIPEQILRENNLKNKNKIIQDNQKLIKKIVDNTATNISKRACIGITGGEPACSIIEEDHLKKIVTRFYSKNEVPARTLRYDFSTSLNFDEKKCIEIIQYLLSYCNRYRDLFIVLQIGIESTDDYFNFTRHGNNWQQFDKNLKLFLEHTNFGIEFKPMYNNVALPNLFNFIKYTNNLSFKYRPIHLSSAFARDYKAFHFNLLPIEDLKYVKTTRNYLDNKKIYFENKESVYSSLDAMEHCFKCLSTSKRDYQEALEVFNYFKRKRQVDLQQINPTMYNHLLKMSTN